MKQLGEGIGKADNEVSPVINIYQGSIDSLASDPDPLSSRTLLTVKTEREMFYMFCLVNLCRERQIS